MGFSCTICDGDSYYEQDGLYFCNECNAQSQEMQLEVDDPDQGVFSFDPSKAKVHTIKKEKPKNRKFIPGKPWVMHEAFQLLLKAQVNKLIEMGFNPQLKSVVKKLWFRYLKNQGVAFCVQEPATINLSSKRQTGRFCRTDPQEVDEVGDTRIFGDENINGEDDDVLRELQMEDELTVKHEQDEDAGDDGNKHKHIRNKEKENDDNFPKKTKMKTEKPGEFEQKIIKEMDRLSLWFSPPEDEESGNSSSSSNSDFDDNPTEVGSVGSLALKRKKKASERPIRMLELCYIGLMLLKEPVLCSDLIRWAREGTLPLYNISDILPEEMKYSFSDRIILSTNLHHQSHSFLYDCYTASRIIKMDFTIPKSLCQTLAASLVFDLEFTKPIYKLTESLLRKTYPEFNSRPRSRKQRPMNQSGVDGYLGALIVIAAKLVYYLDDYHEFHNKQRDWIFERLGVEEVHVEEIKSTISWVDWVDISWRKKVLKLSNGLPRTERDLKYLQDYSTYVDYCTKNVFGSFKFREAVRKHAKPTRIERSFDDNSKEIYQNTFTSIASNLNGGHIRLDRVNRVSTSFPLSVSYTGQVLVQRQSPNLMNTTRNTARTPPGMTSGSFGEQKLSYVHYLDHSDVKSWHESYRYLMGIVSDRVEMDEHNFQNGVQFWENVLFEV